jgi:cytochrome c oxidase assembly protein subunit 15
MRHQHAGLAISDFPLAHHQLWPRLDAASIALYNQGRLEMTAVNPITAFQVVLQMAHRITALLILVTIFCAAFISRRRLGARTILAKLSLVWVVLISLQVGLGAATIWTGKSADIATAHVAIGALSLMTGAMTILVSHRLMQVFRVTNPNVATQPGAAWGSKNSEPPRGRQPTIALGSARKESSA